MPTTKSAKKRHRQSLERRTRNRATKSALKTQLRKVHTALEENNGDEAAQAMRLLTVKLDKSAAHGIIHGNTAARLKSRLSKRLKLAKQPAAPAEA